MSYMSIVWHVLPSPGFTMSGSLSGNVSHNIWNSSINKSPNLDAVQIQYCIVDEVVVSAAWVNAPRYQQNAAS